MVVPHQIADAVHILRGQPSLLQDGPGIGGALLLLQLAVAAAVLFLGGMDADVVHQGGAFHHQPGVGVGLLHPGDELGKAVHLHQMLDPLGVPLVKVKQFQREKIRNLHDSHPSGRARGRGLFW